MSLSATVCHCRRTRPAMSERPGHRRGRRAPGGRRREATIIDYEPLPCVTDTAKATVGTPTIWDDVPTMLCVETFFGDREGTMKRSPLPTMSLIWKLSSTASLACRWSHVQLWVNMTRTPRATQSTPDPADRSSKAEIAEVLGVDADDVRIISKDVGGNFGTQNRLYVEFRWSVGVTENRPAVEMDLSAQRGPFLRYRGRDLVAGCLGLGLRTENFLVCGQTTCPTSVPAWCRCRLLVRVSLITGSPDMQWRICAHVPFLLPTNAYRSSGRPGDVCDRKTGRNGGGRTRF